MMAKIHRWVRAKVTGLSELRDQPRAVALGIASGVFFGFIPLVGFKTLLAMGTDSEWKVLRELAEGDVVMNERVDSFTIDGKRADLPVMGVFVLRDGLIAEWRDYFDLQTIMGQLG